MLDGAHRAASNRFMRISSGMGSSLKERGDQRSIKRASTIASEIRPVCDGSLNEDLPEHGLKKASPEI